MMNIRNSEKKVNSKNWVVHQVLSERIPNIHEYSVFVGYLNMTCTFDVCSICFANLCNANVPPNAKVHKGPTDGEPFRCTLDCCSVDLPG